MLVNKNYRFRETLKEQVVNNLPDWLLPFIEPHWDGQNIFDFVSTITITKLRRMSVAYANSSGVDSLPDHDIVSAIGNMDLIVNSVDRAEIELPLYRQYIVNIGLVTEINLLFDLKIASYYPYEEFKHECDNEYGAVALNNKYRNILDVCKEHFQDYIRLHGVLENARDASSPPKIRLNRIDIPKSALDSFCDLVFYGTPGTHGFNSPNMRALESEVLHMLQRALEDRVNENRKNKTGFFSKVVKVIGAMFCLTLSSADLKGDVVRKSAENSNSQEGKPIPTQIDYRDNWSERFKDQQSQQMGNQEQVRRR